MSKALEFPSSFSGSSLFKSCKKVEWQKVPVSRNAAASQLYVHENSKESCHVRWSKQGARWFSQSSTRIPITLSLDLGHMAISSLGLACALNRRLSWTSSLRITGAKPLHTANVGHPVMSIRAYMVSAVLRLYSCNFQHGLFETKGHAIVCLCLCNFDCP